MKNETNHLEMAVWFEGSIQINCHLKRINDSFNNFGEAYTDITRLMSGISEAELIEQGTDFVIIKTNEGTMKRKNILRKIQKDCIVIEFDEEYVVGKSITTRSHNLEEYIANGSRVDHSLVISDVEASGLLGFFYRIFGKRNIGNAILKSHKDYFEKIN
mgnify:CR=1 FL=1|jgi:hypothetical protein